MLPRVQPNQYGNGGNTTLGYFEDISTRNLESVTIGQGAGKVSYGIGNAFVGYNAGYQNNKGGYNTFLGYQSGYKNAAGSLCTMVGAYSGKENKGSEVVFVGYRAGEFNSYGDKVVAVGSYAMRENVSGTGSVAIGYRASERNQDGDFNTMIGTECGQDNRSGNLNTMCGFRAGRANFLGSENTCFGAFSGYSNSYGNANSFVGYKCGENISYGNFNVAIGAYSLQNAAKAECNVVIGPFASQNVVDGTNCVVIGKGACAFGEGNANVYLGSDAGQYNMKDNNVMIGFAAGIHANAQGSVIIGAGAGDQLEANNSVIIGANSGNRLKTGTSNVIIGSGADTYASSVKNGICIGSENSFTNSYCISVGQNIFNRRSYSTLMGYGLECDANNTVVVGKDINVQSSVYFKDPLNYTIKDVVLSDGKSKLGITSITYGVSNDMLLDLLDPTLPYPFAKAGYYTSNEYSSSTNSVAKDYVPITYKTLETNPLDYPAVFAHGLVYPVRTNDDLYTHLSISKTSITCSDLHNVIIESNIHVFPRDHITNHNETIEYAYTHSNTITNIYSFDTTNVQVPVSFPKKCQHPQSLSSNMSYEMQGKWFESIDIGINDIEWQGRGINVFASSNVHYVITMAPKYGTLTSNTMDVNTTTQYVPFVEHAYTTESDEFRVRPTLQIRSDDGECYGVSGDEVRTYCARSNMMRQYMTKTTLVNPQNYPFSKADIVAVPHIASNEILRFEIQSPFIQVNTPDAIYAFPDRFNALYSDLDNGEVRITNTGTQDIPNALGCVVDNQQFTYGVTMPFTMSWNSNFPANYVSTINPFSTSRSNVYTFNSTSFDSLIVSKYPDSGIISILSSNLTYTTYNPFSTNDSVRFVLSSGTSTDEWTWNINYVRTVHVENGLYGYASKFGHIDTVDAYTSIYISSNEVPIYDTITTNIHFLDTDVYTSYTEKVLITYDFATGFRTVTSNITIHEDVIVENDIFEIGSNVFFQNIITSGLTIDIYGTSNVLPYRIVESSNLIGYELNNTGFNCNVYTSSNIYIKELYSLAFDTFTDIHGYCNIQRDVFEAYNPTNLLYTTNNYVATALTSNIRFEPTTTTTAFEYTYQFTTMERQVIYEPVIQLNSNLLYCANATYVSTPPSQSIIVQNTGIVSSFTQDQINLRQVYIRNTGQSVLPLYIPDLVQTLAIPVYFLNGTIVHVANTLSSSVNVSNPTISIASTLDPSSQNIPFQVARVHILDVHGGYVWGDLTIPVSQLRNRSMSVYGHLSSASLKFIYSSSNYDYVTEPITYSFNMSRTPFTRTQYFNTGVSLDASTLSPYVFHWNNTHTLNINDKSPNVELSVSTFTVKDILENRIVALFRDLSPAYVEFDDGVRIDLIPYHFDNYIHPTKVEDETMLYLQDVALNPHENIIFGSLWNFLESLYLNGQPYDNSKITFIVVTKFVDGFLWNKAHPNKIADVFGLNDIVNNNIYYIPFDANNMSNQIVDVVVKYENTVYYSFQYRVTIKNYIARFDVRALCSTYKQQQAIDMASLYISGGCVADGVTWVPSVFTPPVITSNISTYTQPLSLGGVPYEWTFNLYADSTPIVAVSSIPEITYRIGRVEAVSLRTLVSPVLNRVTFDPYKSQDMIFYVTTPPAAGLIQNLQMREAALVEFGIDDMLSDNIIYQHFGTNNTIDLFELTIASTPFDISDMSIKVRMQIVDPPIITSHNTIHVYSSNATRALYQLNNIYPNVTLSSIDGYINFFTGSGVKLVDANTPTSNVDNITITIPQYAQNTVRFRIQNEVLTSFPYQDMSILTIASVTNDANNMHIMQHPFYGPIFKVPVNVMLNHYISLNTKIAGKSDLQVVSYTFDPTLPGYPNFVDNLFSAVMQVKPYQNILDSTLTDPSLFSSEKRIPKQYEFVVSVIAHNEAYNDYEFIRTIITESSVDIVLGGTLYNLAYQPDGDVLRFNQWNNLLFISQDTDYPVLVEGQLIGYAASFYFDYDPNLSKLQNTAKNLLHGADIVLPFTDLIKSIDISVDNTSSKNQLQSYDVVLNQGDLNVTYNLRDYGTQIQLKNIEMYTSTYSAFTEAQVNNSTDHNVVMGKNILVRGLNNICIGNNFNTSGQNSIILGNTIGKGATGDGFINEVYESIVIGNNSFQNSLVNNVISIGNNNLNRLNFLERSKVTRFLSTKPILIGNDVESIDFNVNVGNTFLKSTTADNKIYLGVLSEPVFIGHTVVVEKPVTNGELLDVNGGIKCSRLSTSELTFNFNTPDVAAMLDKVVSVNPNAPNESYVHNGSMTPNILGVCVGENTIQYQGFVNIMCNDEVNVGDLVTSSNGFVIRQGDDIVRSYTVGRVIARVTDNKVKCRLF